MRVAVFCSNFLPFSQTFVHNEISAHKRHEIDVFAWRRLLPEQFPFPRVHIGGAFYAATRKSGFFERQFSTRGYSLVHAHFGTAGVYAARYAKKFNLPLIVTFHGYDVAVLKNAWRFAPVYWPCAFWGGPMFDAMTLGLCASCDLQQMLIDMGVAPEKLAVHRLGIDVGSFYANQRSNPPVRVVMVGRFVAKKGFEDGLRAFALALRMGVDAELTVVGEGPLGSRLKRLSDQLQISKRVCFAGILPPTRVADTLSQSDILLAPSVVTPKADRDSGIIVVKEACASQVVPIGTWHGGIPEIIDDNVTGFLVSERDVTAMADRILYLAQNPDLRSRMGAAARAKMEREYSHQAAAERLEAFYQTAINSLVT